MRESLKCKTVVPGFSSDIPYPYGMAVFTFLFAVFLNHKGTKNTSSTKYT
jgi:hypothetical protein